MSNSKPIRNQIRDEELDAFFEEHGQEASTKPWQRADWDEKRSEILADNCEWCGGTEDLTIHHEQESPKWWKVWDETRDELFEYSDYYNPINYDTSDEFAVTEERRPHLETLVEHIQSETDAPDDALPDDVQNALEVIADLLDA